MFAKNIREPTFTKVNDFKRDIESKDIKAIKFYLKMCIVDLKLPTSSKVFFFIQKTVLLPLKSLLCTKKCILQNLKQHVIAGSEDL